MTPPPQTDVNAPPTGTRTERVLCDFVRDAVTRLVEVLIGSAPAFEDEVGMERGPDGQFRERKRRIRILGPILSDEWLSSFPAYQTCVECLRSDLVVGPHLDRLVGTSTTASRFDVRNILASLIYAMLDDEGRPTFTCEKFYRKWKELEDFFRADQIAYKTVAPLPYLVVPTFPLRLNDELILDRLTEDEVTRCYHVGVLRATSLRFPMIY